MGSEGYSGFPNNALPLHREQQSCTVHHVRRHKRNCCVRFKEETTGVRAVARLSRITLTGVQKGIRTQNICDHKYCTRWVQAALQRDASPPLPLPVQGRALRHMSAIDTIDVPSAHCVDLLSPECAVHNASCCDHITQGGYCRSLTDLLHLVLPGSEH